jgi:hypothetical protein
MSSGLALAAVGDLVWVPDQTCGWKAMTPTSPSHVVTINGPSVALIKEVKPLIILVNVEGTQEALTVHHKDVYDIGDLYD